MDDESMWIDTDIKWRITFIINFNIKVPSDHPPDMYIGDTEGWHPYSRILFDPSGRTRFYSL